ncbi:unnamed protein product [marine sediment metagenome]|uniref:Uncharacterized protein n=1 Tax=marine sediment metagenome TaxID=412755 RepID=X1IY07_9ZZZZ
MKGLFIKKKSGEKTGGFCGVGVSRELARIETKGIADLLLVEWFNVGGGDVVSVVKPCRVLRRTPKTAQVE